MMVYIKYMIVVQVYAVYIELTFIFTHYRTKDFKPSSYHVMRTFLL